MAEQQRQFWLLNAPTRSELAPAVKNYLQQHKVFIALTTSPARIKYIGQVLQTLDLRNIENILLVLPRKFKRTNTSYKVPGKLRKDFPKLRVVTVPRDLGPITKLLPAVDYARKIDNKAIVITIDDDMQYPYGMVNEMLHHLILSNGVVGGVMYNIGKGATKQLSPLQEPWHSKQRQSSWTNAFNKYFFWRQIGLKKRQFVAGFGGVAYRVDWLDSKRLLQLSQLNPACFKSDDMVISYVLSDSKIPTAKLANNRFNLNLMLSLDHGNNQDALSKIDANEEKYLACYHAMREYDLAHRQK